MPATATTDSPQFPPKEFADRRRHALKALGKSVGVLFAGEHDPHAEVSFRPHPHFEYLTGVVDEPGAILVLDPLSPVEARQAMLFLPPLNPEVEKWDGYRLEIGQTLRERTGFKAVYRLGHLPRFLAEATRRSKSLTCLHPLAWHDQPVSPDLELFRKLAERIPGTEIVDGSEILARLRAVKSKHEISMIEHAIGITRDGFLQAMKFIKPGRGEYDVQAEIEHVYRRHGSRRTAFATIVGSGINSTVLHYRANDQIIGDGDLICIDSGATWNGYSADITRTLPAGGRFSKRQREIYDLVLEAEEAAIKACKPGVRIAEIDQVARKIITKAGYGDAFIHSIGHHLGLETHDVAPDEPLRAGAVLTIEPGVYLPDERIGVRIEDDVLITPKGARNLSSAIPKKASEIERLMAG